MTVIQLRDILAPVVASTILAVACADDLVVPRCNDLEIISILDTSGSVDPGEKQLCSAIPDAYATLDPLFGSILSILDTNDGDFFCVDGSVDSEYAISPNGIPGTELDSSEDWGDAIAITCASHQFAGVLRVIVVVSDECAEQGSSFFCDDEDDAAVDRARNAAQFAGVRLVMVASSGASQQVIESMRDLATETGGAVIVQDSLHGPAHEALRNAILEAVVPWIPASNCVADLNNDCVVDATDLLLVLSAWGTPGQINQTEVDIDGNGIVDATDLLLLLGSWGSCR